MKHLLCLILLIPLLSFAQKDDVKNTHKFFLNAAIANELPVKSFKTFYNYGLGINVSGEYKIFKNFRLALQPGYTYYFYSDLGVSGGTGYFTVLAGSKYFLPYKIYLTAKAGLGVKILDDGSESSLAYSYGAGIYFLKKLYAEAGYSKVRASTTGVQTIVIKVGYEIY